MAKEFLCKALVCNKVPPVRLSMEKSICRQCPYRKWVCIESEGIDFARALRVLDEAFSY